ncbi:hypothetical protein [Marinobacterium stanieri]|uniref:Uncharacterized protein n=1 Tax=Marinobacterium stanieri TaxID=49186 RepID=A0A1N6PTT2_9GAMM|nr:hypothetical protein [Marinobacterium stanieri]SIQ07667.1 hypothetical protein SAMN05421647_10228 [Marinobacterium stanieri]
MSVSEQLTITTSGFAAKEQAMLEVFFGGRNAIGYNLVSSGDADALMINLKDEVAERHLQNWLNDAGKPWVAVVDSKADKPSRNAGVYIERPLSIKALQEGLSDLKKLVQSGVKAKAEPLIAKDAPSKPLNDRDRAREEAFAEWQARKQRSTQAASSWQGEHKDREEAGLNSRFSVHRNELNSLILEAQKQVQEKQARLEAEGKIAPAPEPEVAPEPEAPKVPSLSAEMILQCCGSLSDVNLDEATERRRVYFSLDGLMLPWILRAVKTGNETNNIQQIVGVPGALFYLPAEKAFLVGMDSDLLLQLTRTRFGFDELSLLDKEPDQELPKGKRVAADELVWQLALFTARGRVSDSLSAEEPLLLAEIPDFERLLETPHARSIAELWQSQRLSARNVADMLSIPQRFVFSFLVAADAVGLYCQ